MLLMLVLVILTLTLALLGGKTCQNSFKPSVRIFIGLRAMITRVAEVHIEFASVSSSFNSSVLIEFGVTTCLMRSEFPKLKNGEVNVQSKYDVVNKKLSKL